MWKYCTIGRQVFLLRKNIRLHYNMFTITRPKAILWRKNVANMILHTHVNVHEASLKTAREGDLLSINQSLLDYLVLKVSDNICHQQIYLSPTFRRQVGNSITCHQSYVTPTSLLRCFINLLFSL